MIVDILLQTQEHSHYGITKDLFVMIYNYINTKYQLYGGKTYPDTIIRVGERNAQLETWDIGQGLCIVTAWNPASKACSLEVNTEENRRLQSEIRHLKHYRAVGSADDLSWSEDGFAILNISLEESMQLGYNFKQNAIVWVGNSKTPSLVMCNPTISSASLVQSLGESIH